MLVKECKYLDNLDILLDYALKRVQITFFKPLVKNKMIKKK